MQSDILERIIKLANEKNISQKELSALSGVALQTLYNKNFYNPKLNTLKKISAALGCSVGYLIGECEK